MKHVWTAVQLLGVLGLLGVAGASDTGQLGLRATALWVLGLGLLMAAGLMGQWVTGRRAAMRHRRALRRAQRAEVIPFPPRDVA